MANSTTIVQMPELPSYGFLEVQVWIRKNTLKGAIYSMSFVILLLLLYGIWIATRPVEEVKTSILAKTELTILPNAIEKDKPEEQVVKQEEVVKEIATLSVTGVPIAVPDALLKDDMPDFATMQDQLASSSVQGDVDLTKINDQDLSNMIDNVNIKKPTDEVIPPDDVFVPIEKEPIYDETELQKNLDYPAIAVNNNIQGRVTINVYISKDGKPLKTKILQSDSQMLNDAAVKAVMKTTYTPAIQNQQPVGCWLTIPINFTLSSR